MEYADKWHAGLPFYIGLEDSAVASWCAHDTSTVAGDGHLLTSAAARPDRLR